jgi:hypothetical protein
MKPGICAKSINLRYHWSPGMRQKSEPKMRPMKTFWKTRASTSVRLAILRRQDQTSTMRTSSRNELSGMSSQVSSPSALEAALPAPAPAPAPAAPRLASSASNWRCASLATSSSMRRPS